MYLDNPDIVIAAYTKYSTDIAVELGADPVVAAKEMKEMVELETEIARVIILGFSQKLFDTYTAELTCPKTNSPAKVCLLHTKLFHVSRL